MTLISPPRVVFHLSGPGLQRERAGSNRHDPSRAPANSPRFSTRAGETRCRSFPSMRRFSEDPTPRRGRCVAPGRETKWRTKSSTKADASHQAGKQNGEQIAPRTQKKRKKRTKPPLAARAEQPAQVSPKTKQQPKLTEPAEAKSFRRPQAKQAKQDPMAC